MYVLYFTLYFTPPSQTTLYFTDTLRRGESYFMLYFTSVDSSNAVLR